MKSRRIIRHACCLEQIAWLRCEEHLGLNCQVCVIWLEIHSLSHSFIDSQSTVAIEMLCQCMYKP